MPPAWLHRKVTREHCEELMEKAGLDDGRFLVRTRDGKPGEYVLCVVYKGKPTHHLIAKNADGVYTVNKKTYGDYTKVNRLIDALGKPGIKGWPVPLDKPVNVEGAEEEAPAKPAAAAAAAPSGGGAKPTAKAGAKGFPPKKWKTGVLSREATEEALKKDDAFPDGAFLVRDRPGKPGEYILSVNFKGKPTHHLLTKNDEGLYVINKKTFGGHKKVVPLIATLGKKVPGWPVPLAIPSAPGADDDDGGGTAAVSRAASDESTAGGADKEEAKADDEQPTAEATAKEEEPADAKATAPEEPQEEAAAKPEDDAKSADVTTASTKDDEPAAEKASEPEDKPAAAEATATAAAPAAAEHEPTIEEEEEEVNRTRAAAANAYMDVQTKMTELNALQGSSTTAPTLTIMSTPAFTSTPTDGPELTFMLARAVLNLGQRVNDAEKKLDDITNVLKSLSGQ